MVGPQTPHPLGQFEQFGASHYSACPACYAPPSSPLDRSDHVMISAPTFCWLPPCHAPAAVSSHPTYLAHAHNGTLHRRWWCCLQQLDGKLVLRHWPDSRNSPSLCRNCLSLASTRFLEHLKMPTDGALSTKMFVKSLPIDTRVNKFR